MIDMNKRNKNSAKTALLLLAASLFVACGDSSGVSDPAEDTAPTGTAAVTETAEVRLYQDNLPEDLETEGKTLRLLSGRTDNYGFHSMMTGQEDLSGELVNDAIYEANNVLAERFGITVTEELQEFNDVTATARKTISSGDDAYDIITAIDRDVYTMATENMVTALDSLKYVDLSQPWWNSSINNSLTLGGRLWAGYSDAMLTAYDFTHILLFNKEMVTAYDLDNPYDLVENGTWTFTKFREMAMDVTADVNGDNTWDDNDRYGWLAVPKQISPSIWIASGVQTITKDENDLPVFTMGADNRMLEALQLAYDLSWGSSFWYKTTVQHAADVTDPAIFSRGDALFSSTAFYMLFQGYYREIEFDYGIIPYPKFDEAQDGYYTRVEGGNMSFVPTTCGDTDFAGAMMEAYACEFKNTVIPMYYETGMKVKYSRDDTSGRILDMMMANRIYDLGDTIYCMQLRDGFVVTTFNAKKPITASVIEKNEKKVTKAIDKLVSTLVD